MEKVIISDRKKFNEKLRILKSGGAKALHIITDFDRTLTKEFISCTKVSLSYHPVYECFKKEEYKKKIKEMFDYYIPLESDHTLSIEEKSKLMEEWWNRYFELVKEYGITEEDLDREAEKVKWNFREGIDEFFGMLRKSEVPVLIFSAGVGNLIHFYLKKQGIGEENLRVISNNLIFENRVMVGYTKPLIHTFNKDERHLKDPRYHDLIEGRNNVILLGDSLGDLTMAQGVKHNCLLKIGFLNSKVEERIEKYKSCFDVVITCDGDFSEINHIIKEVL